MAISACVAIAALVGPAAAPATVIHRGGLAYVEAKVKVHAHEDAKWIAVCPKHTRVLGGGEFTSAGFGKLELRQTFPADLGDRGTVPDDGWGVAAFNPGKKGVAITVIATCGDTSARYVTTPVQLSPNSDLEHDVSCPAGRYAYSGGVSANSKKLRLNSEFPIESPSTGWGAYYYASKAIHATSYAVCLKQPPQDPVFTMQAIPQNTQAGHGVECQPGTKVYGGGLATSAGSGAETISSAGPSPTQGGGVFNGFSDFTANYHPELAVYATCGPKLQ